MNYLTIQDVLRLNHFRLVVWHCCLVHKLSARAVLSTLPAKVLNTVSSILQLVSSGARLEMARRFMILWIESTNDPHGDASTYVNIIDDLGATLTTVLEETASDLGMVSRRVPSPPPGTIHRSDGLVASEGLRETGYRGPDETSNPRGGAHQCLFASCAASEDEVIRVVLSIYIRRGRLPEPGEVLFCTSMTTNEELELAVRRFIGQKKLHEESIAPATVNIHAGANERIFVIADVHLLDYSRQAMLLGHLRSKVLEGGGSSGYGEKNVKRRTGGAILLVVSGKPQQAILTWLSDHMVEVPPLPTEVLKEAMAVGLKEHHRGKRGRRWARKTEVPANKGRV